MSDPQIPFVQMVDIVKRFPGDVVANDAASLAVWHGAIHAVIGENGAGKSTLMGILYGRFQPDSGRIRIDGRDVFMGSSARAIGLGIGMVSQHGSLVGALTALENVILGAEPTLGGVIDSRRAMQRIETICADLQIQVDWRARVEALSVAACQKIEIVKALYRGAKLLILDEPTSTLAPQEADALYTVLHQLAGAGSTILVVTHKMREVIAHSARVTVMRAGRTVAERATAEVCEDDLVGLMMGSSAGGAPVSMRAGPPVPESYPPAWERGPLAGPPQLDAVSSGAPPVPVIEVRALVTEGTRSHRGLRDVTLGVAPGEVLGIAGIDGSGQRELAEAIVGLRRVRAGSISLDGVDITRLSVAARRACGVAYIPEDRGREGLIPQFSIADNLLLGRERDRRFGGGTILDAGAIAQNGDIAVQEHRIRAWGGTTRSGDLSGGNQQKVVFARALSGTPRLLVAMQPTRGLDAMSADYVYRAIRDAQSRRLAVLLFSLDLDEIFSLSQRIAVMDAGQIVGMLPRSEATVEAIGRLMLGGAR